MIPDNQLARGIQSKSIRGLGAESPVGGLRGRSLPNIQIWYENILRISINSLINTKKQYLWANYPLGELTLGKLSVMFCLHTPLLKYSNRLKCSKKELQWKILKNRDRLQIIFLKIAILENSMDEFLCLFNMILYTSPAYNMPNISSAFFSRLFPTLAIFTRPKPP